MTRLFLTLIALLLVGCAPRPHPLSQYTLPAPDALPALSRSPWNAATLRVAYPKGIMESMSSRIYYLKEPNLQSYYLYSQWSSSLNRVFMAHLIDLLQRGRLFARVLDYASEAPADYTLETTLYAFRHRITPRGSFAEIDLQARLLAMPRNRVIRSRRFRYLVPCPSTDIHGYMTALHTALQHFDRDLLRWLVR